MNHIYMTKANSYLKISNMGLELNRDHILCLLTFFTNLVTIIYHEPHANTYNKQQQFKSNNGKASWIHLSHIMSHIFVSL